MHMNSDILIKALVDLYSANCNYIYIYIYKRLHRHALICRQWYDGINDCFGINFILLVTGI